MVGLTGGTEIAEVRVRADFGVERRKCCRHDALSWLVVVEFSIQWRTQFLVVDLEPVGRRKAEVRLRSLCLQIGRAVAATF